MTDPVTLTRPRALEAVVAALIEQVEVARAQAAIAHDEATNEETRQEGKYDTRAIEAGYLAEAQARRRAEVEQALGLLRGVAEGPPRDHVDGPCLVHLERPDGVAFYLLAPAAAGLRVDVGGQVVRVLTPSSPLGRELLGAEVDHELSDGSVVLGID